MTENEILDVLHGVQHPELQSDIVSLGMVDGVRIDEEGIRITIGLRPGARPVRSSDPQAQRGSRRLPLPAIRRKNIGVRQGGPT